MAAPNVLTEAKNTIMPAMTAALERLSPEIRRVIDYHMGWRDVDGRPVERRGSKSIRPALALLSAQAAGGDPQEAVPGAIAVEFINNWAFLIDDVMDGDSFRRQRETAWVVFGEGQAICASAALLNLGQQILLESASPNRVAALTLVLQTVERMLVGQTLDMTFEERSDVSIDESLVMTRSKTASLMRCACSIGAVLVGGPPATIDLLGEFGECVGVAFQARDDILGVWGFPPQTGGRPRGFDVRARKGTLPIVVGLQAGGTVGAELRTLRDKPELTDDDLDHSIRLIEQAGGLAWTRDLARNSVDRDLKLIRELPEEIHSPLATLAALGQPDDVQTEPGHAASSTGR